jgi:uncharacterized protein (TIGR02594 family)
MTEQWKAIQRWAGVADDGIPGPATARAIIAKAGIAAALAASARKPVEPNWLAVARGKIGIREIKGAKHEPRIVQWFKRVGASWINDDETPWCGAFVGACLQDAGQAIVAGGLAVRAREWMKWGKETPPRLGAIAVFGREGGGHVGFAVGESATAIYVLGGNQSDAVNIMPIAKSRLLGFRWPAGLPLSDQSLPRMTGGTVSRNEA